MPKGGGRWFREGAPVEWSEVRSKHSPAETSVPEISSELKPRRETTVDRE
ncbi:hypothetical protein TIFTF001_001201 [Ficus carica]|uniref:Uncharacterized protein n=1 Tax=Ficus carica TaxID=3494 RepID=A0AA88CR18_FICCA|nr:hypothetical protein TIFTF001_001201 [Ficus carica]